MSKGNRAIQAAIAAGYTADMHGVIYKPCGNVQKEYVGADGYYLFTVPKTLVRVVVKSHRFIVAFLLGLDALEHNCIRHLDGNKLNNAASNLRPGTFTDNRMDIPVDSRVESARNAGKAGGAATRELNRLITDSEVSDIRRLYSNGTYTQKELAYRYNLRSQGNISRICSGKSWAHIPIQQE